MSTLRHAPVVPHQARSPENGSPQVKSSMNTARPQARSPQANRPAVRYAVDLTGALGLAAGAVTGVFTLAFGGTVILLAGLCLHASSRRPG
ncbi:hypothetical protein SAMN05216553_101457 [Lentzea fradiae]|uniref:Uncharacterized protein n=1 Tax=Lentzea fradiae TaxID=200378 RepID=A0A1G7KSY6_9PSEU|nr:hypothetical protein [Lentzea fradiae]SDF40216.1 hypothetical protein SAMN05216553_101457 [Lentzea fradiae]